MTRRTQSQNSERSQNMSWKTMYRSFYYQGAPEPDDITLNAAETALLVIDIQNKYMQIPEDPAESKRWAPFIERMNSIVIPNAVSLIDTCRKKNVEIMFARIACLKEDGRDRSLSKRNQAGTICCYRRTPRMPRSCRSSPPQRGKSCSPRPRTVRSPARTCG